MDVCWFHPEAAAEGRCLVCGKPLCEGCLKDAEEYQLVMCPDCIIQLFMRPYSYGV